MADFFWSSDAQRSRIEPLLPTDVRGKRRRIDPGHLVDEDGERYLSLSGVNRVAIARRLAIVGSVEKAYDGWHYPDGWVTEGPKLMRRGTGSI